MKQNVISTVNHHEDHKDGFSIDFDCIAQSLHRLQDITITVYLNKISSNKNVIQNVF